MTSSWFFLFLLSLVIIILILFSVYHENTVINSFADKIVILVLFFSSYTAYETLNNSHEQTSFENYIKISNNQFKIIEYINQNYDRCPNFINTFFFNWQKKILSKNNIIHVEKPDNWISVYYISEMIFKSFDNYTSYINKIGINNISSKNQKNYKLINFFIQFAVSDELNKIWNICKYKYPEHTINLGDLLFALTHKYKPTNVIELNKLVNLILNNKYYLFLFEKN